MLPQEKLIHAIISSSIAAHWLREIKHDSVITRQREQNLINKTIKTLLPYEKQMEDIDNQVPKALEGCYDVYFDLISEVSNMPIHLSGEAKEVLKAFKKDPKSLISITKKVLR